MAKEIPQVKSDSTAELLVIGAGLGGLSAAINAAARGVRVRVFEQNDTVGGKMNELRLGEYRFDTGPSLLTMPFVIDDLLSVAGCKRSDLLEFVPVDPICRYFFADGAQLDTFADPERMLMALEQFNPAELDGWQRFMQYSRKIYDATADVFLFSPIHDIRKLLTLDNLSRLPQLRHIDPFRTVDKALRSFFRDERLIQLFNRYATYNGSDPYRAPATLNIIPHVEFGLGGFYIRGGMYRLAEVLYSVARGLGVQFEMGRSVEEILHSGGAVEGVRVGGKVYKSKHVLCNADVVTSFNTLIKGYNSKSRQLKAMEPSLSGCAFLWGVKQQTPQLSHHNILFSSDYQGEFRDLFSLRQTPGDPTVYVAITSKTDESHAPANSENWFVLVNMPYISDERERQGTKQQFDVEKLRDSVLKRLNAAGISPGPAIEEEHVIQPQDFDAIYASNRGSIYGLSSNTPFSAFKRPANRSRDVRGLYFAGGSSHPGGGVPLVLLSGKIAAELACEDMLK